MRFIDIYFYTFSVIKFSEGSVSHGAMGFCFPIMISVHLINYFCKKCWLIGLTKEALLFLVFVMTFLVYLYYKRNDRGRKIITYYSENSKIGKWYFTIALICAYHFVYLIVAVGGTKLIDLILS